MIKPQEKLKANEIVTRNHIIEKIRTLPEDILIEINDFIDFLEIKRNLTRDEWECLKSRRKAEESDFRDYLEALRNYEDILANGKIKWKIESFIYSGIL